MHRLVVLIVLLVAAKPGFGFADEKADTLGKYMEAAVEVRQFNGSVLVAQGNENVLSRGFGMANFEHGVANTPQTKFRIGSITKQFTAMAVMILQERGKLNVGDPIAKYLEDAPDTWSDVTIHHLLTHTSGIPSFTGMPDYIFKMSRFQSQSTIIDRFREKPLEFPPGEKFKYNNSGYFLLGVVIEEASGKSYEEFLREEILDPLDMHDTGYDHFQTVLKHRASGYQRRGENMTHAAYLDMSQPFSAGALYSTVEDLNRWDQALRRRELISEKGYETMFTPDKSNYAYGWMVRGEQGRRRVFHGGGINGFQSFILRYPEEELCIVVLCNVTPANPGKIANDLAAIMLGEEFEFPQADKAPDTQKRKQVNPDE